MEEQNNIGIYLEYRLAIAIIFSKDNSTILETVKKDINLLILLLEYIKKYKNFLPQFAKENIYKIVNELRFDNNNSNLKEICKVSNEIIEELNTGNGAKEYEFIISEACKFYGKGDAKILCIHNYLETREEIYKLEQKLYYILISLLPEYQDEKFYSFIYGNLTYDMDFLNVINYILNEYPEFLKNEITRERIESVLIKNKNLFSSKATTSDGKPYKFREEKRLNNKIIKEIEKR